MVRQIFVFCIVIFANLSAAHADPIRFKSSDSEVNGKMKIERVTIDQKHTGVFGTLDCPNGQLIYSGRPFQIDQTLCMHAMVLLSRYKEIIFQADSDKVIDFTAETSY